ncbi:MAG: two-component system response regulator [Desulfuromonas sp.]|nr:MAG: two-component system response regulator [Desulfuromonas sp.]
MAQKILVVDDSVTVRQMLQFTLTEGGYEVIEAENGEQALKLFENETPDLLITDLNMPLMDGITLAGTVRKLPGKRFMPILMLTTESSEAQKQAAKSVGASGWITKPFKPNQLLSVVKMVLK